MEELLSYYISSFMVAVAVLTFLYLSGRAKPCAPGPWKLPIIGSLHHLMCRLPHRALQALSEQHGPLMFLKLGEVPALIVSEPTAAEEILKNHDVTFADRPKTVASFILSYGARDIAAAPYGEHWRQLRKICTLELLSAKRVKALRPIREEEVHCLVQSISASANIPLNLSEMFSAHMLDITMRATIGGKCQQRDLFLREVKAAMKLLSGFNFVDFFPSSWLVQWLSTSGRDAARCYGRMCCVCDSIIREKIRNQQTVDDKVCRTKEEEDLLDVLLRLQHEGAFQISLTKEIITSVLLDMFLAGTDTTASTMEWAMSELLKNPHVMEKAQSEVRDVVHGQSNVAEVDLDELNYLRLVIKETLRLHPPFPLLAPRRSRAACQIMGYDIPEGVTVFLNQWAMGRDARYWDNAEEFKPERFHDNSISFYGEDFKFIPFGAGRRICPGMLFGLRNIELTLANLLYHFDWEPVVKPHELDMAEAFGVSAPRRTGLMCRAVLHARPSPAGELV